MLIFLIFGIFGGIVLSSGLPVLENQNHSLDWYGPPSKLRALFFPELVRKYLMEQQMETLEVLCSGNVGLDVSFKNCSCDEIICDVKKSFNRIIDTNCNDICCRNVKLAADKQISVRHVTNEPINNYKCGISYKKQNLNSGDIFNNKISEHNEFPWTVQINSMKSPICVGTLIHPKIVMTTAVCIFMQVADDLSIKFNKNNEIGVSEIIVHEKFARYFEQLNYDIALLVLDKPVELNNDVNIVCLPLKDSLIQPEDDCYVASLETEKNRNIYLPTAEKFVMVPNSRCQQVHRSRRNKYEQYVHDGNICAASTKGSSPQFSFSGAPLICSSDRTQFIQNGILAWSTKVNKSPNIFTNVSKFRNWIDTKFDYLGLDKNIYNYD